MCRHEMDVEEIAQAGAKANQQGIDAMSGAAPVVPKSFLCPITYDIMRDPCSETSIPHPCAFSSLHVSVYIGIRGRHRITFCLIFGETVSAEVPRN